MLLDNGADLQWTNRRQANVMLPISKRGYQDFAELCKAHFLAQDENTTEFVNKENWLRWCKFVNNGNITGWTPLHSAAKNQKAEFFLWLVKSGAIPSAMPKTNFWPVHCVYKNGNESIGEIIKALKWDVNEKAKSLKTGKEFLPKDLNPDFEKKLLELVEQKAKEIKEEIEEYKENRPKKSTLCKTLLVITNFLEFRQVNRVKLFNVSSLYMCQSTIVGWNVASEKRRQRRLPLKRRIRGAFGLPSLHSGLDSYEI